MTLLDACGVVAGYGETEILHGVSITVGMGEVVTIIGPNGCGKSTLMKAIVGLIRMRSGSMRDTSRQIGSAWTPAHTTAVIVLAALAIGFLPFVKMGLVVNGIFIGAIIALGAIGLTLIYGILNFANIAHGDYMTLGAYAALFIVGSLLPKIGVEGEGLGPFTFGYPLLIALPIAAAVALDVVVYRRLRDRGMNAVVVSMASLGVAIALRGLVQLIWGGDVQRLPRETRQVFHLPMDVRIPPDAIFHRHRGRHPRGGGVSGAEPQQNGQGHACYSGQPRPSPGQRHRYPARHMVDLDNGRGLSRHCRHPAVRISGEHAAHNGLEVPHPSVRRRNPGRHRKPIRRAGGCLRYRSNV